MPRLTRFGSRGGEILKIRRNIVSDNSRPAKIASFSAHKMTKPIVRPSFSKIRAVVGLDGPGVARIGQAVCRGLSRIDRYGTQAWQA